MFRHTVNTLSPFVLCLVFGLGAGQNSFAADGAGIVYVPNSYDDSTLYPVTLTGLDSSGDLSGHAANVTNSVLGSRAHSDTYTFEYNPAGTKTQRVYFCETMAYYHATSFHDYMVGLGFAGMSSPVSIVVFAGTDFGGTWMPTSSRYSTDLRTVFLGSDMFADDSEAMDGDVIVHEFAHAVQHAIRPAMADIQINTTPTDQARAIMEGHADYAAASRFGRPELMEYAAAMWNRGAFSRNVDNFYLWADHSSSAYDVGMVFSGALWDLRSVIGAQASDTIAMKIIETVIDNDPGTPELNATLTDALNAAVQADSALYGGAYNDQILQAFAVHGVEEEGSAYDFSTGFPMGYNPGDDYDDMQSYEVSGATELSVTFDEFVTKLDDVWFTKDVEPKVGIHEKDTVDYLEILDGDGALIGTYTGRELQGQTIIVPGDTVWFHLVTDSSLPSFGYRVVDISAVFDLETAYEILIETFGSRADLRADFNGDGRVDLDDFAILRANWQAEAASAGDYSVDCGAPIPEPTTLGMLVLGGLAVLRRHRSARELK